ncbi:MAG: hypothetical protein KAW02_01815 [candidate division Zixibacteria bacterium]|nr:hypothetical protein [candidate division Zixibacteria bacterium]
MSGIFFSSVLKKEYLSHLESLMFFNPQQGTKMSGIMESIERFGNPKTVIEGDFIRIKTETLQNVQALFAFDRKDKDLELVGVVVYVRTDPETMVILHVAVENNYSVRGSFSDDMLVMKLIAKVREAARQIKGVRQITIFYERGVQRNIPV